MSTDFQLVPTTDADPTPLDTEQDTVPAPTTTPARPESTLDHTPGGLPAIPLAVIASNTTIAGLSAAAILAGPVGAAAAGAVALGGVVAVRASAARSTRRRTRTAAASRSGAGSTRSAAGRTSGPRPTASSSASRSGGSARKPSGLGSTGSKKKTSAAGTGTAKKTASRVGQVKALRKAKTTEAPTRKERRSADTAARRGVKDARRQARRDAKNSGRTPAGTRESTVAPTGKTTAPTKAATKPAAGRTAPTTPTATSPASRRRATCASPAKTRTSPLGRLRARAQDRTDQARTQARGKRDQAVESRRDRIKNARKAAKSRAVLGRRLAASGIRYGAQAAGRALLAAPVGVLGALTTPIGRRLGWAWLQYPGRRLFRRLIARAKAVHEDRVRNARKQHEDTLNTLDPEATAEAPPIADTVARAPRRARTLIIISSGDDMFSDNGFNFADSAQDMESKARSFDPSGMMSVLATIEKDLPSGIESVGNTFAVLAERCDSEFPLEKEVGSALEEVHALLMQAQAAAEAAGTIMRRVHEQDIARHEEPRNGVDAERQWDIDSNQ